MSSPITVYTVGHSNHTIDNFLDLLERNGVTALADVRSSPFSRHNPQFNKDVLSAELKKRGIAYVFVGKELGARSDDLSCYEGGKVRYGRLARTSIFKTGIERVLTGAQKYRIALMCAEKEPLDCHRTLLISRALEQRGVSIVHILADGSTETHAQTMSRLLDLVGLPQEDMFYSRDELIAKACELQEEKIAYVDESLAEQK
ncbi:DUF488 domain-containing protein [Aquaspirillum serpens]|uniref:DUF488 domain-containing protein n=1 Tax=Aquaspirillum serpens TaxID=190 RepID=UPI0004827D95|nr:DUF488 domain-containing protein [Aquaspirillum serpens]